MSVMMMFDACVGEAQTPLVYFDFLCTTNPQQVVQQQIDSSLIFDPDSDL